MSVRERLKAWRAVVSKRLSSSLGMLLRPLGSKARSAAFKDARNVAAAVSNGSGPDDVPADIGAAIAAVGVGAVVTVDVAAAGGAAVSWPPQ